MSRSLPVPLDVPAALPGRIALRALGRVLHAALRGAARALTGVRAIQPAAPGDGPCIYFANHASHGDIVLVAATLPKGARHARPVAASDYWERSPLRRFLGHHVFDIVPIDRAAAWIATAPLGRMIGALDRGDSLVLFPEGTRNTGEAPLLPFKCGLWYLGRSRPAVALVPVWIDNAARSMPKGRWLPVPVLCTVAYGAALHVAPGEDRAAFMRRAEAAVEALRPRPGSDL